jgi:hypothetical protein
MTKQLLIYRSAVPVSAEHHSDVCIETKDSYAFSADVNAVPLLAMEVAAAAAEYAVVFAGEGDALVPTVVLGMRDKENAYLDAEGAWHAKYIPAFIRGYPFVFSKSADGQNFILCVDESASSFNREGRGQALFGADGAATPYVDGVLNFLQQYQAQFQRTRAFCDRLRALDLLEPMEATLSLEGGEKLSLAGFKAVNREKFKALSASALADLVKSDELELVYLHLYSMRNFDHVRERLAAMAKKATDAVAAKASDAAPSANDVVAQAGNASKKRTKRSKQPKQPIVD